MDRRLNVIINKQFSRLTAPSLKLQSINLQIYQNKKRINLQMNQSSILDPLSSIFSPSLPVAPHRSPRFQDASPQSFSIVR